MANCQVHADGVCGAWKLEFSDCDCGADWEEEQRSRVEQVAAWFYFASSALIVEWWYDVKVISLCYDARVVLYPEGTTTDRSALLSFRWFNLTSLWVPLPNNSFFINLLLRAGAFQVQSPELRWEARSGSLRRAAEIFAEEVRAQVRRRKSSLLKKCFPDGVKAEPPPLRWGIAEGNLKLNFIMDGLSNSCWCHVLLAKLSLIIWKHVHILQLE